MKKLTFFRPDSENTMATVTVYTLAEFANEVKLINAIGPRSSVDGVGAMLRSGKKIEASDTAGARYSNVPYKISGKWKTWTTLLGYDTWQLLGMENDPMLMPELSAEHLWRVLREPRFTTPVLRQWAGPILQELQTRKLLRVLEGWNTKACYCYFDDEALDKAVSSLIKRKVLSFEGAKHVEAG
jgi:hypothetical protein